MPKQKPPRADKDTTSLRDRMSDDHVDRSILSVADRLQWFALIVPPQKEFVAQKILRRYGLRTFVPVRREWRRRNKFSKEKELRKFPLTPRYLFAGFDQGVPLWFNLFNLPVISGVVGIADEPMPIPVAAMCEFITKTGGGMNAPEVQKFMRTHREFKVGDLVEIVDSPFDGLKVPVHSIEGNRAKVVLELFGGQVDSIEIALDKLVAA